MENIFKGNSEVDITRVSVGVDKIVPYSLELDVREDSDLWDLIMKNSSFQAILDGNLQKLEEKHYASGTYEREMKRLDKFKADVEGCTPRITIKIELEKYE